MLKKYLILFGLSSVSSVDTSRVLVLTKVLWLRYSVRAPTDSCRKWRVHINWVCCWSLLHFRVNTSFFLVLECIFSFFFVLLSSLCVLFKTLIWWELFFCFFHSSCKVFCQSVLFCEHVFVCVCVGSFDGCYLILKLWFRIFAWSWEGFGEWDVGTFQASRCLSFHCKRFFMTVSFLVHDMNQLFTSFSHLIVRQWFIFFICVIEYSVSVFILLILCILYDLYSIGGVG